jgi:hypothetical protein
MSEPFPDHLISIRNDLRPGDVGYITYLHGILYAPEQGWDHTFGANYITVQNRYLIDESKKSGF